MKRLIFACALTGALSGCAAELLVLPIAVVAAPVVAAADAIVVSAGTKQPYRVVSASGRQLAAPLSPDTKPVGTFTTVNGTVQCNGSAKGSPGWLDVVEVPVRCSNGMRGSAWIGGNLSSGYEFRMVVEQGESRGLNCHGFFQGKGKTAGPFLINCGYLRSEWTNFNKTERELAVVGQGESIGMAGPDKSGKFTIMTWVAPL